MTKTEIAGVAQPAPEQPSNVVVVNNQTALAGLTAAALTYDWCGARGLRDAAVLLVALS